MAMPLTIIGGFLGAGKTTLLKNLIENAQGRRLALLVNDFGQLNIDAALIRASGADSIELSNGCVCCSLGDDLLTQLIKLENEFEKDLGKFDHVVIEASGVADPWKIAQIGLVAGAYRLDSVIVVIDTQTIDALLMDELTEDSVTRQLARADIVLANKADLSSDEQRHKSKALIAKYLKNPHCLWVESIQGELDINLALGEFSSTRSVKQEDWPRLSMRERTPVTKFRMLSFSCAITSQSQVQETLAKVATQAWQTVMRGKAIIQTSNGWAEWHKVGNREDWVTHEGKRESNSHLVLIGITIDNSITAILQESGWKLIP
jgi:G3E family GTPase